MEFIKTLLSDFDPSALLPKLDTFLGKVELIMRVAVMAGPLVLLGLGLWYLLLPPKEANHSVGYRFFWGMNSVEAWRFTQKVAGITWGALGLILTIVMFFLSAGFRDKEMMDLVELAVKCIFWEMGLVALSCIGIDIAVVAVYDSKGVRRRARRRSGNASAEELPQEEYPQEEYPQEELPQEEEIFEEPEE